MIDWQELIFSIRRVSNKSIPKIAQDCGLCRDVLSKLSQGKTNNPTFNTGVALIQHAKDIGADLSQVRLV